MSRLDWIEVRVHTTSEAEEAVSHLLLEVGAEGTAVLDASVLHKEWETPFGEIIALSPHEYPEEGVWISGYFPAASFDDALPQQLVERMGHLRQFGLNPGPATVVLEKVAEESWAEAWKAYYKPIRVTDRLTVKPHWETYEPASTGEKVIQLDPGMAFGTGAHPTTILSMKLLERQLQPEQKVIDVGCGSGVLSIAAACLGAREVLALDLDPLAVESTSQNVRLNGLEQRIAVRQGNLLQGVRESADGVISNILAEIILQFTDDLPQVIQPGGWFIASGVIVQKEKDVVRALSRVGLQVTDRLQEGDWVAMTAQT
ncbi:50S ribosomal protein L11 methyltransferase [Kroppenstedtia sanguinis]|uniref:Ribosomal protein L11 methyltransferase n=1 Tax=Kroppenstedtia sanguinis TaxID=1380684 RepID=A0ABW4C4P1_9BACL